MPTDDSQRCLQHIPGWFKGQDVYLAAHRDMAQDPSRARLFVEVGAYLGQSACFMSHLLKGTANVRFDVVDYWGSLPPKQSESANVKDKSATPMQGWEVSTASWAPVEHQEKVVYYGKGDFQLTWAHYVQAIGDWASISKVVRGSSKDPAVVEQYAPQSIDFLYLDTSHDESTLTELRLWWPKVKSGGRMCGDDLWAENVLKAMYSFWAEITGVKLGENSRAQTSYERLKAVTQKKHARQVGRFEDMPHNQWCAYKEDR